MSDSVFLDSNIILYTADTASPARQAMAARLLSRTDPAPVISTQVIQETYVNARKKFSMSVDDTRTFLKQLALFRVIIIDLPLIHRAIDLTQEASLSFWDALIIAAAASAGCAILYTEDLNHGQVISGVKVVNPFHPSGAR